MEQKLEKEYFGYLSKIKEAINENRAKAMVVVNSAMIITYYRIGTIINEKKQWGDKYIKRLSNDLREFGKSYSYHQLIRMTRFAKYFTEEEIMAQPVPQIPWSSIITIIGKSSSKEESLWYINQAYQNRWSRSDVLRQFELQAYSRGVVEPLTNGNGYVDDIVKDSLAFTFISKDDVSNEEDLKNRLIDNIILFLQELGTGFALVGKEYKLVTPSNKIFRIDLLMYHTKIHAYVVFEVKLDEIMPSDFGQLNFYVNAINDLEKAEGDNDTVGILLCKKADKYVAETSIAGISNPIGITKYKLFEELPNFLAKRLNDEDKFI